MKWRIAAAVAALVIIAPTVASAAFYRTAVVDNSAFSVDTCNTDRLAPGSRVLSTYGNTVFHIGSDCRVERTEQLAGPINVWTPDPVRGGGLGIVHGKPVVVGPWGGRIYDGTIVRRGFPGYPHHELIRTAWGTFLTLTAVRYPSGVTDDVIVEFDGKHNILATLSLNSLVFGDPEGSVDLGEWGEDWLHSNSLDTRAGRVVMVSLRNLDTIMEIDWTTGTEIRRFGSEVLSLQHHARYVEGGEIVVYNNGVRFRQSKMTRFTAGGDLVSETDLPFFAPAYGSVEVLPNGNILTVDGVDGWIYELSPDGTEILAKIRYLSKDWVPFKGRYMSLVYRVGYAP